MKKRVGSIEASLQHHKHKITNMSVNRNMTSMEELHFVYSCESDVAEGLPNYPYWSTDRGDGKEIVLYSVTGTCSWILFCGCSLNLFSLQILSGRQLFSIKIISCQYLKMYTCTCSFIWWWDGSFDKQYSCDQINSPNNSWA